MRAKQVQICKQDAGDELLSRSFSTRRPGPRAENKTPSMGLGSSSTGSWKNLSVASPHRLPNRSILQRVARGRTRQRVQPSTATRRGELISVSCGALNAAHHPSIWAAPEACLTVREQVPRESFRAGGPHCGLCGRYRQVGGGPQIIISRGHKGLLEKLFRDGGPGDLRQDRAGRGLGRREAGRSLEDRGSSRDRDVDPVGACWA